MLQQHQLANATFQRPEVRSFNRDWRAKVPVEIETTRFSVGVCDSDSEFWEAINLRNDVFQKAFPNLQTDLGEVDALDPYADVLYVREHETGRMIASYRLIHSKLSPSFYSLQEFDLTDFLAQGGSKLELSRACVAEDFRNGVVLHLLWRGIAAYMIATESQYLFGLTSVQTYDLNLILDIYRYLHSHDYIGEDFAIHPTKPHDLLNWYSLNQCLSGKKLARLPEAAPPLLKSYLRAGAKVYGSPAVDHAFGCFDFLTILAFDKISKSHAKKYLIT